MQTDPTACHSPIGSFQRPCYLVSAPAATGQLLPTTTHRRWRHDSNATAMTVSRLHSMVPGGGTRSMWRQRPGDLRMLMLVHLGVLAVGAGQPTPPA